MGTVVEGNFTAADQVSDEFVINRISGEQARFQFDMRLGASTTGTCVVQVWVLGGWVDVTSKTATSSSGIVRNASGRFRIHCSVYSGSNGITYGVHA